MNEPVRELPFQQFIVKLHSRCNLSCDYCYVYHHVDQSWRDRPKVMSRRTIAAVGARIGEHAETHRLEEVFVVLHGGEPLLAGPAVIEDMVNGIRGSVPAGTSVDVTLQTNGTLVDHRFADVFARHDIGVGISVDGGREANDRHRRFANGHPSFALVQRGIARLRAAGDQWTGLLCTVDLDNDPLTTYEDLLALHPPQIDLLLPLANWVHPPAGHGGTAYADWLIPIFDRWFSAPRRQTGVRLFESIISMLLGGSSDTEAVGLNSARAITIETDGQLEATDALKTTAPGLGATGLSVHRHTLDDAMRHPRVLDMHRTLGRLPAECQSCPIVDICGGGQTSHRYGNDGSFAHRSVYCADLDKLIRHINDRVRSDLKLAA
ncbi:FxsB family cyclophane-forming radical SAM/SPASM peptide maturase [Actinoplanes sp. RD1]|uniref:FxsB family cyclophane-forming radical SAM/SPASM peptide maturase n=1 Tax=Actinoplanes sp. RD1 TaxID=3064538 RepID=UPI00274106ED|nr:FxsB family cyclophane-forming radical SAM/SPASM peptide maturase [Actinoplanes sp. RD1]